MNIGEFFIKLGFTFDNKQVQKAETAFKSLRSNIVYTAAAFSGAIFALDRFVKGTGDQALAFQNLSNQTGIAVEEFQRFESIGRRVGLGAGVASQGIVSLQEKLTAFRTGQGDIVPFRMAGIDAIGKNVFEVLAQLRQKVLGMDNALATHFITQLGLSPEFINILKLSDKEFTNLSKNAFFTNQKGLLDLRATITELKLRFNALHDQIVSKLAPALTKLINELLSWFTKNKGKIVNAITSIVDAIQMFSVAIVRGIGFLSSFIERITGMQNGLKIIALGFTAIMLSFRPFLLGLSVLITLLDDIAVWSSGKGKSLFGNFYDAIAKLGKNLKIIFEPLITFFETLWETIEPIIDKIGDFFDKTGLSDLFKGLGQELAEFAKIIGGGALAGGAIGSIIPGVGTATGAGIGGLGAGALYATSKAIEGAIGLSQNLQSYLDKENTIQQNQNTIKNNNIAPQINQNITVNGSNDTSELLLGASKQGALLGSKSTFNLFQSLTPINY